MASETRRRLFRDLSCTFFLTTLTPQGLLVGIINYGSLFLHIKVNSNTQRFFPLLPVATTLSWPIGVKYSHDPNVWEGSDFLLRCEYAVATCKDAAALFKWILKLGFLFLSVEGQSTCSKVEKGHQISKVRRRRLQPVVFFSSFFSNSLMARWFRNEMCASRVNAMLLPKCKTPRELRSILKRRRERS